MSVIDRLMEDENFSGLILSANEFKFPLLFNRVLTIGRHHDNIIIIKHKTVSRNHCRISFDGKNFRVDDLESKNGTSLNGRRIETGFIKSGDELKVGEAILQVRGEMRRPPEVQPAEAEEDPGVTQILDLDFEKIRSSATSEEDRSLVEKLKQVVVRERKLFKELAFKDGLTGVYNRRYFDNEIERFVSMAKRYYRKISLLMIDIDFFKRLNDTHGHQAGDDVLKWVGKVIEDQIRDTDIVARYGGEEFAVILTETAENAALAVADKIRTFIADQSGKHFPTPLTISIGIAEYPGNAFDAQELVNKADKALYQAKKEGRNRVRRFSETGEE